MSKYRLCGKSKSTVSTCSLLYQHWFWVYFHIYLLLYRNTCLLFRIRVPSLWQKALFLSVQLGISTVSIYVLLYISLMLGVFPYISSAIYISKYVFTLQNQGTVCRLPITMDSECAKISSNGFPRSNGTWLAPANQRPPRRDVTTAP